MLSGTNYFRKICIGISKGIPFFFDRLYICRIMQTALTNFLRRTIKPIRTIFTSETMVSIFIINARYLAPKQKKFFFDNFNVNEDISKKISENLLYFM